MPTTTRGQCYDGPHRRGTVRSRTPYDFTHELVIGGHVSQDDAQLKRIGGFDHNWFLRGLEVRYTRCTVFDPASGRILLVQTTEPGLQFIAANTSMEPSSVRAVWPTEGWWTGP